MAASTSTATNKQKPDPSRVDLADAGLELGKTYHQILALVMKGELKGGRVEGRWFVDRKALDRYAAKAS